jgi:RimJ/RimL family protein N-acetyltransferase
MLAVLCRYLFEHARVNKIFIDSAIDNNASLCGIEKVGFKLVGQFIFLQFRNRLIYKKRI